MVYSQKLPNAGHAAFYTFAAPHGGFAIVAGDDVALPILAYSYENLFQAEVPDHVASFLADIAGAIDAALAQDVNPTVTTRKQWIDLAESPVLLTTGENSVGPLLTTRWSQGNPYNLRCPSVTGQQTLVGCVALAMGQLIRYWQYPETPRGIVSYNYPSYGGYQSVNFDNVTYDYASMPDELLSSADSASIFETSRFLHHCGVSVAMSYGHSASSSNSSKMMAALVSTFFYSPTMREFSKSSYQDSTWELMLKNELSQGRPVLYAGSSSAIGHAYVCDGYNGNSYHFNFGWGGLQDGFYLISPTDSVRYPYSSGQTAIFGIEPDSSSRTLTNIGGGTTCTYVVKDTVEFISFPALNGWGSVGGGYTIMFEPEDTAKQLQLEIIDSSIIGGAQIYDGIGRTSQFDNTNNLAKYPLVSSNHGVVLEDLDYNASGCALRVIVANNCGRITNLRKELRGDTIQLFWHDTNATVQWLVEYGPAGFAHGTGTEVIVSDSTISFIADSRSIAQDYYVRPYCEEDNGVWVKFSDRDAEWSSVVTNRPTGYVEDDEGNITISTPEGLAWLISVVNGFNGQDTNTMTGKVVTLVSDINLEPYRWTPIALFNGRFDGGGHTITNMSIMGTQDAGFFKSTLSQAYIMNLHLRNVSVIGNRNAAAMCASFNGRMDVCSVSGVVKGTLTCGGMVSRGNGLITNSSAHVSVECNGIAGGFQGIGAAIIKNCYARGSVIGENHVGGFLGYASEGSFVSNCYSSGSVSLSSFPGRVGAFVGTVARPGMHSRTTTIRNCYAYWSGLKLMDSIPCDENVRISDTACFWIDRGTCILRNSVMVENTACNSLLSVLNSWVSVYGDSSSLNWEIESTESDDSLPRLGSLYEGSCPVAAAVSLLQVDDNSVRVSWDDNGASSWQIEYGDANFNRGVGRIASTSSRSIVLDSLRAWTWNDIYIRSICEDGSRSQWVGYSILLVSMNEVIVESQNPDMGTVLGGGFYPNGSEVQIRAIPYDGYRFVDWNDGSTENPRTLIVNYSRYFSARFMPEMVYYSLTATSADPSMGTVLGSGTYEAGAEVTLTATANEGYRFVGWQDGNADNPRTVTVTADATYIATFEAEVGINEVDGADGITLHPNPACTKVTIFGLEQGSKVSVVDLNGREVSSLLTPDSSLTIDVSGLAQGAYFVRIVGKHQQAIRKLIVK